MAASVSLNFLRRYFFNVVLKAITLVAVLRLLGSLLQVLGPTYDKLFIPNFDIRKGNFNLLLQERVASPLLSKGQNSIHFA